MDKITKYRNIVEKYLRHRASLGLASSPGAKGHLVVDREKDEYVLLWVGWSGVNYKHGLMFHLQIMEGDIAMHLEEFLPSGQVGHIQIAGVPARAEPDVGEICYPYLFDLIDSLGYKGWIGSEYFPARNNEVGGTTVGLGWLPPGA